MTTYRMPYQAPRPSLSQGSALPLSALGGQSGRRRRTYRHGALSYGLGGLGLASAPWGSRARKAISEAQASRAIDSSQASILNAMSGQLESAMTQPTTLSKKEVGAEARRVASGALQGRLNPATLKIQDAFNDAANWLADQYVAGPSPAGIPPELFVSAPRSAPARVAAPSSAIDFTADFATLASGRAPSSAPASSGRGRPATAVPAPSLAQGRGRVDNTTARGTVDAHLASAAAVTPPNSPGGGALSDSQQSLMLSLAMGRQQQPAQGSASVGTVIGIAVASVAALALLAVVVKR